MPRMIFHCTLALCTRLPGTDWQDAPLQRGPRSGSTPEGQLIELSVEVPDPCPGADLEAAIARRYGTGELSVRGAPVAAMTVGAPPLVPGAVLVETAVPVETAGLVRTAGPVETAGLVETAGPVETATLLLAVDSGPGAGMLVALRRGRFRIGRGGTEIVIPDAALSREHARLDVSDSVVTIVDLGSANGTSIDGRKVRTAPLTTASQIRCGDSVLSLRLGPPGVPGAAEDTVTSLAGSSGQ